MARVCDICGKGPVTGSSIVRKGLEKKKGGIGLHTTGISKRRFLPNLQKIKAEIDGSIKTVKICAKCLRSDKVHKVQ